MAAPGNYPSVPHCTSLLDTDPFAAGIVEATNGFISLLAFHRKLPQVSPKSVCSGALVFINAPTLTRQLEICFCSLFNYADKSLGNAFIQICGRSRNGEIFVGKTPHLAVVHYKHEWSCLNKGVYKPLFENHLLPGCDAAFRSGLVFLLIFFF